MNRLCIPLAFTIALAGCAGPSPTADAAALTPEDRVAIDAARAALVETILAGDATAYARLCTDDVRLLHPDAPIISGREALQEHNAAIFDVVSVTSLVLMPVEVFGAGDLAYEVGTQEVAISPSDDRFRPNRKYVHVLRRGADGQWRFAVLMSNNS